MKGHTLKKGHILKYFILVEVMKTLHNSLPWVKVGFTSLVVLKIYPAEH